MRRQHFSPNSWLWWFLLALSMWSGILPFSGYAAEAQAFRQEIRWGIGWSREISGYSNYVNYPEAGDREPNPDKSERFEKSPWSISGQYTFFLSPLVEQDDLPKALWRFYARPTTLTLSLNLQPKTRVSNTHTDRALGYQRRTETFERIRHVALAFEHYMLPRTGLFMEVAAFRNDDDRRNCMRFSDSLAYRTGTHDGLRREYTVGLSHYISQHISFRGGYARLAGTYRTRERGWSADSPAVVTRYYADSDLAGNHLFWEGTYLSRPLFGVTAGYNFRNYRVHADYLPVFPKDLADSPLLYDDEMTHHHVGMQISVYPDALTTLRAGGTYTHEAILRSHKDFSQSVDYAWQTFGVTTTIERYFSDMFGIYAGYQYSQRTGNVAIAGSQDAAPTTTYDTTRERHSVSLGLIGRF